MVSVAGLPLGTNTRLLYSASRLAESGSLEKSPPPLAQLVKPAALLPKLIPFTVTACAPLPRLLAAMTMPIFKMLASPVIVLA